MLLEASGVTICPQIKAEFMSCKVNHLIDPATGQVVSVVTGTDGSVTLLNPDGSAFGGDATTLRPCADPAVWEYVEYNPSLHDIGVVEGSGTESDPWQIPLPCCDTCPTSATVQCCQPEATFTALGTAAVPGPAVNSMTEIAKGQQGWQIFDDDQITKTGSIPIPAATDGCVVMLQLNWMDQQYDTFGTDAGAGPAITVTTTGSSVSSPNLLYQGSNWDDNSAVEGTIQNRVYAVDVLSGAGGSTFEWDFTQMDTPAPVDGAFTWVLYEVCGISVSDLGVAVETLPPQNGNNNQPLNGSDNWINDTSPIDMGSCDALFFGFIRHPYYDASLPENTTQIDQPWSTPLNSNVVQLNSYVSGTRPGGFVCQLGNTAGWIPGGSGPAVWTFGQNVNTSDFIVAEGVLAAIPLVNCDSTPGSGATLFSDACTQTVAHPCPEGNLANMTTSGTSDICITAAPGNRIRVVAVVDGVDQGSFVVDNTTGSTDLTQCGTAAFNVPQGTVPAGGVSPSTTVRYRIEALDFVDDPANSVTVGAWCADSTLEVI